jgi:hypothetical protein
VVAHIGGGARQVRLPADLLGQGARVVYGYRTLDRSGGLAMQIVPNEVFASVA